MLIFDNRRNHTPDTIGITSFTPDKASAEDASQARTESILQVMAALRKAAISVLRFTIGHTKISKALREFAARLKLAVKLIQ